MFPNLMVNSSGLHICLLERNYRRNVVGVLVLGNIENNEAKQISYELSSLWPYGFIFLSLSDASAVVAAYPPFGLSGFSMLPIPSYLIIFGLYSTAISISQDVRLRKYIKDIMKKDSGSLRAIGQAQLEKHVQAKREDLESVVKEQRKELEEKSGIQSSIQEQDISGTIGGIAGS